MKGLTDRQSEILKFIQSQLEAMGLPPTYREIATAFKFSSPNAAVAHVRALREKGYLKTLPHRARAFTVTDPVSARPDPARSRPRLLSIPIFGAIPAGYPRDTESGEDPEGCMLIDVETVGIKPTARTFGLRVRGDSMIGKHILDGDLAILEHGVQPRHGDVVAALIDGQVTLKTFILQRNKAYLRAENPRYPDLIPREELQIQGVLMALVRKRKV
jgi:repressor LexA